METGASEMYPLCWPPHGTEGSIRTQPQAKMPACSGCCIPTSHEEMAPKQPQDSGKRSKFNEVHYYQESISDQGGDHLEDKNYT